MIRQERSNYERKIIITRPTKKGLIIQQDASYLFIGSEAIAYCN
jgi:hypothetical protein